MNPKQILFSATLKKVLILMQAFLLLGSVNGSFLVLVQIQLHLYPQRVNVCFRVLPFLFLLPPWFIPPPRTSLLVLADCVPCLLFANWLTITGEQLLININTKYIFIKLNITNTLPFISKHQLLAFEFLLSSSLPALTASLLKSTLLWHCTFN